MMITYGKVKNSLLALPVLVVLQVAGFSVGAWGGIAPPPLAPAASKGAAYTVTPQNDTAGYDLYSFYETFNGQTKLYPAHASNSPTSWTFTKTTSGLYYYRARYCDTDAGQWRCDDGSGYSDTATVAVVLKPPRPGTIKLPSSCDKQHKISWPASTAANFYQIQKRTGTGGWQSGDNSANPAQTSYTDAGSGSTSDRYYQIRARYTVNGHVGDFSPWKESARCKGNTKPTVSLTSPSAGAVFIKGAAITVSANATDTGGAISEVQFYYNDVSIPGGPDVSSPYSVTWIPTQTGSFLLKAVATDDLGATTTSSSINIVVHEKPVAYITSPDPKSEFDVNKRITIKAKASDSDGIASVEFFNTGAPIIPTPANPVVNEGSGVYSIAWVIPSLGTHNLTVRATDKRGVVGNLSNPVVPVYGVNPEAPETAPGNLTVNTGTNNTTGKFIVQWNAVLNAPEYLVQVCTIAVCSEDDWVFVARSENRTLQEYGLASGIYHYRVRACNDGGCGPFSEPLTITVTLVAPQQPGKMYLMTVPDQVCSDGFTHGNSPGYHYICWDPVAGLPTHYEVQEKKGTADWQTLPITSDTVMSIFPRSSAQYRYHVRACNSADEICSEYGAELEVNVIDRPIIFGAAVLCSGECIQISGLGFGLAGRITVMALDESQTSLEDYVGHLVAVHEGGQPDTIQIPMIEAVATALSETGIKIKVSNNIFFGKTAEIELHAGNQKVVTSVAGDAQTLDSALASPATVSNSGIIYTAVDNQVHAYSVSGDLQPSWPFVASGEVNNLMALSADQSTLYIGTTDGQLHAVHSADSSQSGEQVWVMDVSFQNALAPPLVDGYGFINLGSMDSTFHSIDPLGYVRWSYSASAGVAEQAVEFGDGYLIFYSLDQQRHKLFDGEVVSQ
jgi:Bacterial Ig domain